MCFGANCSKKYPLLYKMHLLLQYVIKLWDGFLLMLQIVAHTPWRAIFIVIILS